jgi:hypothetical protein
MISSHDYNLINVCMHYAYVQYIGYIKKYLEILERRQKVVFKECIKKTTNRTGSWGESGPEKEETTPPPQPTGVCSTHYS